jgi:hypothetical protein
MPCGADDSPEQRAFEAAAAQAEGMLAEMAEVPAAGLAGFVLKVFLYVRSQHGGSAGAEPCAVRAVFESDEIYASTLLMQSLLKDAARFMPELAPLVMLATSSPVERRLYDAVARLVPEYLAVAARAEREVIGLGERAIAAPDASGQ